MSPADSRQEDVDPRIYFAAERTLLAWVRTGLAMMGFGFVVARFGLFLRELAAVKNAAPTSRTGLSLWIGSSLVLLGVGVNVAAAVRHGFTIRRLRRGEPLAFSLVSLGMVIALLLGIVGTVIFLYLIFSLGKTGEATALLSWEQARSLNQVT